MSELSLCRGVIDLAIHDFLYMYKHKDDPPKQRGEKKSSNFQLCISWEEPYHFLTSNSWYFQALDREPMSGTPEELYKALRAAKKVVKKQLNKERRITCKCVPSAEV